MTDVTLPASTATEDPTPRSAPPLGRLYEVGGRRLALHRSGAGGPVVVFLPGAGLTGLDFLNVHESVARFTTSVVYDRAGTGWSDPVKLPRSAAEAAHELKRLLEVAAIAPPYVLVSHSLGGAYARRFAQLFPGDVAGMVFLDPADEGYVTEPRRKLLDQLKMAWAMLPALVNMRKFYRPMFARMFAAWPEPLRRTIVDYHVAAWAKSLAEAKNLHGEVLDEIRNGGPLPDAPLIVLTAMGIDPFMAPFMDEAYLRELNLRKAGYYTALAGSVPRGQNWLIDDAGHSTLHTERPDEVVEAIRTVIELAGCSRSEPQPLELGLRRFHFDQRGAELLL